MLKFLALQVAPYIYIYIYCIYIYIYTQDISRLRVNELKTSITTFIRNISQVDLKNVFANKIERVQACIDARGHHLQHLC
jgi:uncharacterized Fe-S cluster-containing radical SAM superfamily enzyme